MHTEPYASACRIFWIVDNGSSHNGSVHRPHAGGLAQRRPGAPAGARFLAEPFGWKYTWHDLNDYLHRLAAREPKFAA